MEKQDKQTSYCNCNKKFFAAFILAFGIALGGFFPGYYYYKTHINNNSVTVKGLAEADVVADLAIWKLKYVITENDLLTAQQKITTQTSKINNFLLKQGFNEKEIKIERIETNDLMANPYRSNDANTSRFILTQTIIVKSNNVALVESSIPQTDKLIAEGVVFDNNEGYPVSYIFTKLNDIKPKMLAEATQNAKKAAEEFAKNSGSLVGKIRRANQGVFSILPREQTSSGDETQQINKTVRVVSTVEYWLE
ncbi:MAG: SIMPL domain-containing protein [Alphaproteobacteria bacterium]|nr:SIMPL domain-containing protein [Alphaproteobacteria bacterium]